MDVPAQYVNPIQLIHQCIKENPLKLSKQAVGEYKKSAKVAEKLYWGPWVEPGATAVSSPSAPSDDPPQQPDVPDVPHLLHLYQLPLVILP